MIVDERGPIESKLAEAASAEPRVALPADVGRWSPLALVLAVLPAAALAELLLIRTFYRVGIYIPKHGAFPVVYRLLTAIGSFAFNLSTVLAVMALALLILVAWRQGLRSPAVALGAYLLVALASGLARAPEVAPLARLLFVLAVVTVAWPFVRGPSGLLERLAVAAVAAAALLSSYAGLTDQAGVIVPSAHGPGGAIGAELVGEVVVLVAAFLLFAAWVAQEGLRLRPIVAGVILGVTVIAAWLSNGAITGILVLWTTGLRLYLPLWVYAVALGAFSAAAFGWLSAWPWRAAGCALLLVGGFLMDSTYLQMLVLLGIVLLTDGRAVGGLPITIRRGEEGYVNGSSASRPAASLTPGGNGTRPQ